VNRLPIEGNNSPHGRIPRRQHMRFILWTVRLAVISVLCMEITGRPSTAQCLQFSTTCNSRNDLACFKQQIKTSYTIVKAVSNEPISDQVAVACSTAVTSPGELIWYFSARGRVYAVSGPKKQFVALDTPHSGVLKFSLRALFCRGGPCP